MPYEINISGQFNGLRMQFEEVDQLLKRIPVGPLLGEGAHDLDRRLAYPTPETRVVAGCAGRVERARSRPSPQRTGFPTGSAGLFPQIQNPALAVRKVLFRT